MNRRSLLKGLGAILVGGGLPTPSPALPKSSETVLEGFGMAPIKEEGATIAFDRVNTANFARALWPGLKKRFEDNYKNNEMFKL